jgi:hypothetical protein
MKYIRQNLQRKSEHFYVLKFLSENCYVHEIVWKNMVQIARPQMIIRSKRFSCRTPNVTNTHSEHVTLGILLFHRNNDCTNMPQCYVIRTLAVLFKLIFHESNETLSAVTIILPIWLQGRKTLQHVSVAQDIN